MVGHAVAVDVFVTVEHPIAVQIFADVQHAVAVDVLGRIEHAVAVAILVDHAGDRPATGGQQSHAGPQVVADVVVPEAQQVDRSTIGGHGHTGVRIEVVVEGVAADIGGDHALGLGQQQQPGTVADRDVAGDAQRQTGIGRIGRITGNADRIDHGTVIGGDRDRHAGIELAVAVGVFARIKIAVGVLILAAVVADRVVSNPQVHQRPLGGGQLEAGDRVKPVPSQLVAFEDSQRRATRPIRGVVGEHHAVSGAIEFVVVEVESADRPARRCGDRVGEHTRGIGLAIEDDPADLGVAASNRHDRAAIVAVDPQRVAERGLGGQGIDRRHRDQTGGRVEDVLLLVECPFAEQFLVVEEDQGAGQVTAADDDHVVARHVVVCLEAVQRTLDAAVSVEGGVGINPDELDRTAGIGTRLVDQRHRVDLATTVDHHAVISLDRTIEPLTHRLRSEERLGTSVGQRQHDVQPGVGPEDPVIRHRHTDHHIVGHLSLDPGFPAGRVLVGLAGPVVHPHETASSEPAQNRQRNSHLCVEATVVRLVDSGAINQQVEASEIRVGEIRRVVNRVKFVGQRKISVDPKIEELAQGLETGPGLLVGAVV